MATSKLKRNALIFGYIREQFKDQSDNSDIIPTDIKKLIEMFYPLVLDFIGSKLGLMMEEKQYLTEYLSKLLLSGTDSGDYLSDKLLYDGARDGLRGWIWHNKIDGHKNTLSIIKTEYDHIFGCYASEPFGLADDAYFPDLESFLCVIRTQFKDAECPKFAPFVGKVEGHNGETYYGPYSDNDTGPAFGWAFDLIIWYDHYQDCYVHHHAQSRYPNVFGNELCGGKTFDKQDKDKPIEDRTSSASYFTLKCFETFEIIICPSLC